MTDDEQNAAIADMATERASLKRALICMDHRLEHYQKALSQASMALMQDIPLRSNGDGITAPVIPGLYEGGKERDLPCFAKIVKLQDDRRQGRERLKDLDAALDGLGIGK